MEYCAIIGDIVGSKNIKDRQKIQDEFNRVLNKTNEKFDDFIASNFTITLGDEFQGLLFKPDISLEIIEYIRERMDPVELVFGVGIGHMETAFTKETSIGSDGPAYWYARKMVEKAKNKKPTICYYSNSPEDELINSLLYLSESIIKSRTKKQREIMKQYWVLGSQEKVAEKLGISQSAVSQALQSALAKQIESCNYSIRNFLKSKGN